MTNFLLALVIIVGGWWLLRKLAGSQPAQVRGMVRKMAGGGIILAGGILTFKGASNVGIPLLALGAGMIGETSLFPNGIKWPGMPGAPPGADRNVPATASAAMTREEAYAVLGLRPGATADDVRAAHRRLMKDYHPDKGGSDYLAAKINRAKDMLVQELGAST